MKKRNGIKTIIFTTIICSVIGSFMGAAYPITNHLIERQSINNTEIINTMPKDLDSEIIATLDTSSKNTVEIIKKVKPSIACITTIAQGTDFFNQVYQSEGAGSGIAFHKDNEYIYIVTNNHVIQGATKVSVSLSECDLLPASLVGKETSSDLAVIKVSINDLKDVGITNVPIATFANSDNSQVGETVIAIGNALGNGNTATRGIISSRAKDIEIENRKLTVFQTDAAINPGNSGGALVNSSGQVIGINTAKIALAQVEGVGYSIASNIAKPIIEQLMNSTNTPALGVYITSISDDVASEYGLPQAGVLVQELIPNGSAANSDIKAGDLITSFNNAPIFNTEQLTTAVKQCKIGDKVIVKIIRNGQEKTVNITMLKGSENAF